MTTTDDGLHDPAERPTEPLDETAEERAKRLNEPEEQSVEAGQQERADKRNSEYTSREDAGQ
jgi:hypothetical protein